MDTIILIHFGLTQLKITLVNRDGEVLKRVTSSILKIEDLFAYPCLVKINPDSIFESCLEKLKQLVTSFSKESVIVKAIYCLGEAYQMVVLSESKKVLGGALALDYLFNKDSSAHVLGNTSKSSNGFKNLVNTFIHSFSDKGSIIITSLASYINYRLCGHLSIDIYEKYYLQTLFTLVPDFNPELTFPQTLRIGEPLGETRVFDLVQTSPTATINLFQGSIKEIFSVLSLISVVEKATILSTANTGSIFKYFSKNLSLSAGSVDSQPKINNLPYKGNKTLLSLDIGLYGVYEHWVQSFFNLNFKPFTNEEKDPSSSPFIYWGHPLYVQSKHAAMTKIQNSPFQSMAFFTTLKSQENFKFSFLQGCWESLGYVMKNYLDSFDKYEANPDPFLVVGGLSRNIFFMELLTSVLNHPIYYFPDDNAFIYYALSLLELKEGSKEKALKFLSLKKKKLKKIEAVSGSILSKKYQLWLKQLMK